MSTDLLRAAMAWIDQDPDQETRHELALLIEKADHGNAQALDELASRFSGHLTFGTAGLRAEIGPGPMRMNRVVVSHAAHGLGQFLLQRNTAGPIRVVIGFDARTNSDVFARATAEILAGLGITPILFDQHTPTPVLAFALRHLDADAGVMVTASHNPPTDNGYKVYLGGEDHGSQIVPPADSAIHAAIMASHESTPATELPRKHEGIESIGEGVIDAYVEATRKVASGFSAAGRDSLTVCYTPMHGVGAAVFERLVALEGFSSVHPITAQEQPDRLFPTVSFPNPEEPGALDLAQELATNINADIIVAHDPDADRLAVALPSRDGNGWMNLTGNEVGSILAASIAERAQAEEREGVLGFSVVSSPITSIIARENGFEGVETPTGFKWISRLPGILFGFEEALGYLVNPDTVRDKDGISAGLYALCLAAEAHAEGKTLWDVLDEVRARYGGFASGQVSLRFDKPAIAQELMALVRENPAEVFPSLSVASIQDYLNPPPGQPTADLMRYDTEAGDRIIIRPSGTEPKLKVYLDCIRPSQADASAAITEMETVVREAMNRLSASLS
jgi:phosphomannomutase